jgi:4-amino-4-deoxy-L-arabinose transferase-like glycosyltransferase
MPKHSKLLLAGLLWVAAYLRIPALFANHYHADEALFSSWARLIAVWRDPLLASQSIDKPPLLFYLQALFFPLMGAVEWASRLPNFIASLLLVPLVAILAWRIYHNAAISVLAAIFVVLSPILIQYSSTAYTDPLLTTLLILSLLLVNDKSKPVLSGLLFGLAVAVKFQAWLFLPLLFGFAWLNNWSLRQWGRWLAGLLPVLLTMAIWEFIRTGVLVIWSNQISNFGGLRIIYSWEMLPRLSFWINQWQMAFGSSILLGLFALSILVLSLNTLVRRTKTSFADLLLISYIFVYLILHWLIAVPVWDRYLLPLMPLAAILLARGLNVMWNWIDEWLAPSWEEKSRYVFRMVMIPLILAILLFTQVPIANSARFGQWPLGGQRTADQGAWQIAEFLADEPYGTVLYDHWYSWQWRYHLFDKGVYVSWFPHPTGLAEDLGAFGDTMGARYIVLPDAAGALPVQRAIRDAGFRLKEELRTDYRPGMILYRVERQ